MRVEKPDTYNLIYYMLENIQRIDMENIAHYFDFLNKLKQDGEQDLLTIVSKAKSEINALKKAQLWSRNVFNYHELFLTIMQYCPVAPWIIEKQREEAIDFSGFKVFFDEYSDGEKRRKKRPGLERFLHSRELEMVFYVPVTRKGKLIKNGSIEEERILPCYFVTRSKTMRRRFEKVAKKIAEARTMINISEGRLYHNRKRAIKLAEEEKEEYILSKVQRNDCNGITIVMLNKKAVEESYSAISSFLHKNYEKIMVQKKDNDMSITFEFFPKNGHNDGMQLKLMTLVNYLNKEIWRKRHIDYELRSERFFSIREGLTERQKSRADRIYREYLKDYMSRIESLFAMYALYLLNGDKRE